jgi:hypothetical protein
MAAGIEAVTRGFQLPEAFVAAHRFGSGHINDTWLVSFHHAGLAPRFILQRINTHIFTQPFALMENIQRVTTHLAMRIADEPDSGRRVLSLIATRDGGAIHIDQDGGHWRAYRFIENARTYDTVESPQQAYQAARAFGRFQQMLADLPAPRLHDTIPDFHHTPKRLQALERAIEADVANRAASAKKEIAFVQARRELAHVLVDAGLPERVTHNDTKFNNVMLDDATGEGLCVIDLDTVMPGLALYDFGDMVRTTTSPAPEDERDLSKVTMQFAMYEALVRGYLSTAGSFLSSAEKDHLAFSGKLITFEQGIRSLTDYLAGDVYYKISREEHNLDRCRTQFRLIESIEVQEDAMEAVVRRSQD